tara:strand:- start:51 stop:437 length:387 start_codon:yes stop_codon:yes gene_type:complete
MTTEQIQKTLTGLFYNSVKRAITKKPIITLDRATNGLKDGFIRIVNKTGKQQIKNNKFVENIHQPKIINRLNKKNLLKRFNGKIGSSTKRYDNEIESITIFFNMLNLYEIETELKSMGYDFNKTVRCV